MNFALSAIVCAVASLLAANAAFGADAPSATANVNLVSDYRFRGIDQTWGHPAVQGGADLSWSNGLYAGTLNRPGFRGGQLV